MQQKMRFLLLLFFVLCSKRCDILRPVTRDILRDKCHDIINQVTALEVDFDEEPWYTVLEKYGMKVGRIIDD